ncbi:MAG: hypothetical protein KVP17_002019 [Porospora cf. gigantea B]|uniref:uncharacterized protein n=1 Tax=Porospora cf. gigantea B TaxID=2853592 RepID=UPI003571E399|nr:MAG: hypothetical protein KVP17_002019 [Porospora cf. gigantea B]
MVRVHPDVKTSNLDVMLGMLPITRSHVDGLDRSTIPTSPSTTQANVSVASSVTHLPVGPVVPTPPPVMIPDTVDLPPRGVQLPVGPRVPTPPTVMIPDTADLPPRGTLTKLHNVDTTTVTKRITTRSKVPHKVEVLTRVHMEHCSIEELETIYRELQNLMQSERYIESQKMVNEILTKFTDVTIVTPISDEAVSTWYRTMLTTNVQESPLYSSGILEMENWTSEVIQLILEMEVPADVKAQSLKCLRSNSAWMYLTYLSEFGADGIPLALAESAGEATKATGPRLTNHSSFESMVGTTVSSGGGDSILSRFQRSHEVDKSVASKESDSIRKEIALLSSGSLKSKTDAVRHLLEATLNGNKPDPEAIRPLQDEFRTESRRLRHYKEGVTFSYLRSTANAETTAPLYRPMVVNRPMESIQGEFTDLDVFLYTLELDKVGDTRQLDLASCEQPNASHRLEYILASQSLRSQTPAPANARFVEDTQDKAFYRVHNDGTVSILMEGLWMRVNPCSLVSDFSDRFRFTDSAITGDIVHYDRKDVSWDTLNGINVWDGPVQEEEAPARDPNAHYVNESEGCWSGTRRGDIIRLIAAENETTPDPINAPRRRLIEVPSLPDGSAPHRSGHVWSRPLKTTQPKVQESFATGKRWTPPVPKPVYETTRNHAAYNVHQSSWIGTEYNDMKRFQHTLKQLKDGLQGLKYLRRLRVEKPALVTDVPDDVLLLLNDEDAVNVLTNVVSNYQTRLQNYKRSRSARGRELLSGKADEFFTHCGFLSRAAGASHRSAWEGSSVTSPTRSPPSTISGGSVSSSTVWQRDGTGAWRNSDGRVSQRTSTLAGTNGNDWVEIDGVWSRQNSKPAAADATTSTHRSEDDWTLINGIWTRVKNATTASTSTRSEDDWTEINGVWTRVKNATTAAAEGTTSTADATWTATTTVSAVGGTLAGESAVSHVAPTATANTYTTKTFIDKTSDDYKLQLIQRIEELCAGINSSADAGVVTEEVTTTLSTANDSVTSGTVTNLETGTSQKLQISPGMKHFQDMVDSSSNSAYTTVKSRTLSRYSVKQV